MKPLIFVPASVALVQELRAGAVRESPGYAATTALRDEFGYGPDDTEEADFAAQLFASLACLIQGQDRCVLVVEVDRLPAQHVPAGTPDTGGDVPAGTSSTPVAAELPFGALGSLPVSWLGVQALFVDEPTALADFRAYPAHGRTLTEIWDDERLRALTETHDLLWFGPLEVDQALTTLMNS